MPSKITSAGDSKFRVINKPYNGGDCWINISKNLKPLFNYQKDELFDIRIHKEDFIKAINVISLLSYGKLWECPSKELIPFHFSSKWFEGIYSQITKKFGNGEIALYKAKHGMYSQGRSYILNNDSDLNIRDFLIESHSLLTVEMDTDGILDLHVDTSIEDLIETNIKDDIKKDFYSNEDKGSLQVIFYGAPGTGKSNKIKEEVDDKGQIHFRTTFHPDSDYSTFVGCYKPRSHKKNMLNGNGINETQLLSSFFNSNGPEYKGKNKARYLYEALVHTKDIRDLGFDAQMVADKLTAKGFTGCPYTTEANCMYNIYDWLKEDGYIVENKLSYEFTPQTFIKAYVRAWKEQKDGTPVYLIIEEINRGNCAQIFGDLFQLLDRDEQGFSRYEVTPDTDLQEFIADLGLDISGIFDKNGNDISSQISDGSLLKLPNNLYIWATMNTSDQSLFPIDSAFKRRWDWEYMKIKKEKDEKDNDLNWKIEIKLDDINYLDWWDFIEKINEIIATMTSSADKQLGYFFCLPNKDGKIDLKTFVSKVIFYLWNDVFKDYGFEDASLFQYTSKKEDGTEINKELTFPDFYDKEGKNVETEMLKEFLKKVMSWKNMKED
ncbi:hypothetical protein [Pseudobutyrivibrio sp.]|jgi:hypothetical protein|uniref:hypothetical protein n=1 Tax=Pseudobutyrivibrio sp. TaxID=2014367 RepID=UPI0025DB2AFF|nr:hypothetical protein [Pseudobutyrivibrio sp.]